MRAVRERRFKVRASSLAAVCAAELPAGFRGERHSHRGRHLLVVVSGALEDCGDGRVERVGEGQVRQSSGDESHLVATPARTRLVLLTDVSESAVESATPRGDRVRSSSAAELRLALSLGHALAAPECDGVRIDELTLHLLNAHHTALRFHAEPRPRWLVRMADRIRTEYARPLTVDALCSDLGVSRFHATRTFRRHYGCTLSEYIRQQRVEHVRRRLRSDVTLSMLAQEAGFADQSHMTRVCREVAGLPPGALRRQGRA